MPRPRAIASAGVMRRCISIQRSTSLPHGFPIACYPIDGLFDFCHVCFVIGLVPRRIEERSQVAHCRKSAFFGLAASVHQFFGSLAEYMVIDAGEVAASSAQKLATRQIQRFSQNIPECDVDRTERPHNCGASKMGPPIEILPVVLDLSRVLADEITLEGLHGLGGCLQVPPGARFPDAADTRIGMDDHDQVAIEKERFDVRDFHSWPTRCTNPINFLSSVHVLPAAISKGQTMAQQLLSRSGISPLSVVCLEPQISGETPPSTLVGPCSTLHYFNTSEILAKHRCARFRLTVANRWPSSVGHRHLKQTII